MDPFPFFVGRGRSGTTLLRAIFDSHPEVAVPDETHFIVGLSRRRRRYERRDGFDIERFVADLAARRGFRQMGLAAPELGSDLQADPPPDFSEAIRRVYRHYAGTRGKTRYADKTPVQVLSLRRLGRLFPEARFVHIIRDGREVALSYLDAAWGPDSAEEAALLWKRAVTAGRRAGRALGPGRYLEVRYEELVDQPEATVRAICSFLDLGYDPVMLRYHERAHEIAGTMGMPEARQSLYLPPTRGIRDWRDMAPGDLARFEALAGDLLTDLGYPSGTPPSRSEGRAGACVRSLRWHLGRARGRANLQLKRARRWVAGATR